jgi:hypothetical protein
MHRAVDPSSARRIVLTAEETICPVCEGNLSIRQHRERYVWRLDGLVHQVCRDKRCLRGECAGSGAIYRPPVDLRLALPRMSFGLDVVVTVGERHLDRAESQSQIGRDLLEQGVPIHKTHVGELLRTFVALCQMARGDQEKVRQRLVQQGGIYLMVDGVQFDDRSPVLYLCWDARSGTPLFGERLAARDAPALNRLLRRVKRLGVPVRGITTDAEKGLVPAVAQVFPEVPHPLCHTHFLKNCARPLEEDLRPLGASVEQRAERVRKLERRLKKQDTSPPAGSETTPEATSGEALGEQALCRTLCEVVRIQARRSGKAPLEPPELVRHERLEQVRETVEQASKKKTPKGRPSPRPGSMTSQRPCRSTGIGPGSPVGSSGMSRSSAT